MAGTIEKVTALITRHARDTTELLLFEHPAAGIQIPAGTVDMGETPVAAVLREATEETGLTEFAICTYLGATEEFLTAQRLIAMPTSVYARPDPASFDWVRLPRGLTVTVERQVAGFAQATYQEFDCLPNPTYVSYQITGWVPERVLADKGTRHFFHLVYDGASAERWVVAVDTHHFTLFRAPVAALPAIIPPQDTWIALWQTHLRST